MAEDRKISFKGEINESDIEKENLRPSDIDGIAGGAKLFPAGTTGADLDMRRPAVTDEVNLALVNAQDESRPLDELGLKLGSAEDK